MTGLGSHDPHKTLHLLGSFKSARGANQTQANQRSIRESDQHPEPPTPVQLISRTQLGSRVMAHGELLPWEPKCEHTGHRSLGLWFLPAAKLRAAASLAQPLAVHRDLFSWALLCSLFPSIVQRGERAARQPLPLHLCTRQRKPRLQEAVHLLCASSELELRSLCLMLGCGPQQRPRPGLAYLQEVSVARLWVLPGVTPEAGNRGEQRGQVLAHRVPVFERPRGK
jgi:hypothetical protein